jgi:RNA polymerase sigma-70 factor (ECF subfamily)
MNDYGDTFQELYDGHYNDIYKFTYRLLGNGAEAEEITQETFLCLHRALQGTLRHDNLKGWLFRTAANMCYNQLKRKKRYHRVLDHLPTGQKNSTDSNPVEAEFMKDQEMALMRVALDQLPVRDRLVLMLYQNGLSYADMARAIRVKKSSFRKILYRAVDKLARTINRGGDR